MSDSGSEPGVYPMTARKSSVREAFAPTCACPPSQRKSRGKTGTDPARRVEHGGSLSGQRAEARWGGPSTEAALSPAASPCQKLESDDEGVDDERLDECEADDHRGEELAACLGVAGDAFESSSSSAAWPTAPPAAATPMARPAAIAMSPAPSPAAKAGLQRGAVRWWREGPERASSFRTPKRNGLEAWRISDARRRRHDRRRASGRLQKAG